VIDQNLGRVVADLHRWASSLRDAKAWIRSLFTQERVAASAGTFLDGLLGDEQRKTGWMRAEAAGSTGMKDTRDHLFHFPHDPVHQGAACQTVVLASTGWKRSSYGSVG